MESFNHYLRKYLGTLISILFALCLRLLDYTDIISVNSSSYIFIGPFVVGFIPFCFKHSLVHKKLWAAILSPLLSVLIFLVICLQLQIEDYLCLIIIGLPYILLSVCTSVLIFYLLKKKKTIHKSFLLIILLPIGTGSIEQNMVKTKQNILISNSLQIKCSKEYLFNNLKAVPKLQVIENKTLELNLPHPILSTYDEEKNVRLGYFNNGIILHESIDSLCLNEYISFRINFDKSDFSNIPTLIHAFKNKMIDFKSIAYQIRELDNEKCELKLSCNFVLNSELQNYAKFWSSAIINQFEQNLLIALKATLERNYLISLQ